MIKVIIIDDEKKAQETLELFLDRYFPRQFKVLAKCSSIDEGVKSIQMERPDILFLDVQMPKKNGFAIFEEVKKIDFDIIFTTAHKEYALQAWNSAGKVFGYLLKPIDISELQNLMNRFFEKQDQGSLIVKLDRMSENMENLGIQAYNTLSGIEFVHFDEILYCEASMSYTTIHKADGSQILVSKNLKVIQEKLPIGQFIRMHHKLLVNVKQILRIDKKEDFVLLKGGIQLSGSSRKMKDLKKYFAY
ncbi:hypothetical protein P872_21300 [Rhodonellum psychrophilum GCM71 = DSM 17998]|uniref:Uncharacterized protein n=2 Tax=Rhodonellum TaxID=336827 RepID=U5BS34_9BACT|nr:MULTISPECIES: LytTR family DNA-binding domain-containing protein [Rhodonellum]ERM80718.1 hypothetical protein P872_21300 [Rhodonellum psychrophilum GCM71 = DSM 17998]MDO9552950.1 LytTR family DNA-binding domain-containing protein [Rhodonellum sp.]SDZ24944.1 two component transcriptional regulator, LytTR family [Rhodonellum ikkaensis]